MLGSIERRTHTAPDCCYLYQLAGVGCLRELCARDVAPLVKRSVRRPHSVGNMLTFVRVLRCVQSLSTTKKRNAAAPCNEKAFFARFPCEQRADRRGEHGLSHGGQESWGSFEHSRGI